MFSSKVIIISTLSCDDSDYLHVFQSLHAKVVHQYQQHYRNGPPTSGDEECLYWIRFLTYHMAKAALSQVTSTHHFLHFMNFCHLNEL